MEVSYTGRYIEYAGFLTSFGASRGWGQIQDGTKKSWTFSSDAELVGTYGDARDDAPTIGTLGVIVYKPQKCVDGVLVETDTDPEDDEFGEIRSENETDGFEEIVANIDFLQ